MKNKILVLIILLSAFAGNAGAGPFDIIPLPVSVIKAEGAFLVKPDTKIIFTEDAGEAAGYASAALKRYFGLDLKVSGDVSRGLSNSIFLQINHPSMAQSGLEGYVLKITPAFVLLTANSPAGIFYGIQTIGQMLSGGDGRSLPASVITDYPRFSYRGMHLDVARHFLPIQSVYKLIDYMAIHKLNVFHWHLVDDQGWRLEIRKYPELTETGAWRVDRENLHWNSRPAIKPGEKATYGGYYTQEEVKALVKYAQSRFITVIPEIEMPAHAMSALAAYPELSCTGQNQGVPPGGVWPITHIYCAGKEETFTFLENVLSEVMELFPSTIIHVGGDEADKSEWKKCPLCQKRIREEGLKNEQELQSYFIQRIEKYLNKNGRKVLGWDEILEGGLAPEAAVMSWRGEEGGIAAARMGHHVVMTPSSHCYFDYYQGDPSLEPLAIGGYLTLKKVYSYEPVPKELSDEQGKMILGAQANLWAEFVSTPDHAEYMYFPRLAALAEVVWSPKESRNWDDFCVRMEQQYDRYDKLGINYARSAFQVTASSGLVRETKSLELEFSTETSNPEIRYTLDGSDPSASSPLYTQPVRIDHSLKAKAAVFKNGKPMTAPLIREFLVHKAIACPVTMKFPNSKRYDGKGEFTLVDGVRGSTNYRDGNWKGFSGADLVATIDLGRPATINSVESDALQDVGAWIFFPGEVVYEVSTDGTSFRQLGKAGHSVATNSAEKQVHNFLLKKKATGVRFIRVTAKNIGVCPKGHTGEGKPANLFVSEIVVK